MNTDQIIKFVEKLREMIEKGEFLSAVSVWVQTEMKY